MKKKYRVYRITAAGDELLVKETDDERAAKRTEKIVKSALVTWRKPNDRVEVRIVEND